MARRLVVPTQCTCCIDGGLADSGANGVGIVHAEISDNEAELELPQIGNHTKAQSLA